MNSLFALFKFKSPFEKILAGLLIVSILVKYLFNYSSTVDVIIFGGLLSILYFPLGFYFLEKPAVTGGILISIILGFIYSVGIVTLVYGFLKIDAYLILLSITTLITLSASGYLLLKLNSNKYPNEFLYPQFGRIVFVIITNLIILLKYL